MRFLSYSCWIATLITSNMLQEVSAQTPPDFQPVALNHLGVSYPAVVISPAGVTVSSNEVTSAPSLSLTESNDTFVAIMMDFSVNLTGSDASNMTLLHWVLPGLSSLNETMTLSSSQGVIAPYYPPGPPAGQTHTYGIFLYKQPVDFAIPTNYISFFNNLTASVVNRIGFNLTTFALEAGLGTPVAANWFLVSTPIITTSSIMASTVGSNGIIPTTTMSVTGTNTSMGSSFTASIGATSTQSIISGAKKVGIESIAVAINTLWLVEIFL